MATSGVRTGMLFFFFKSSFWKESEMALEGINLEDLDYSVLEATLESYNTQTLTPIIKEELRLKIQTNRLAAGKEELPRTVFKEPEKVALTKEEEKKRENRKERNRIAAAKCRQKRKTSQEQLLTELAELQLKNFTLKQELERLELEKQKTIQMLLMRNVPVVLPSSNKMPESAVGFNQPFDSCLPTTAPTPEPACEDEIIDFSALTSEEVTLPGCQPFSAEPSTSDGRAPVEPELEKCWSYTEPDLAFTLATYYQEDEATVPDNGCSRVPGPTSPTFYFT